ncbi:MAG: hypothetical protein ABIT96_05025 [Ferruginibacter sp.]
MDFTIITIYVAGSFLAIIMYIKYKLAKQEVREVLNDYYHKRRTMKLGEYASVENENCLSN